MSAAPAADKPGSTTKATTSDGSGATAKDPKPAAALEEDDEFEDFPVDGTTSQNPPRHLTDLGLIRLLVDWTQDDTEVPGDNTHLWEESWDDDDTSEDFSAQLKYENNLAILRPSSCVCTHSY